MGRDTIQLENAVSTISQEYLLEFTSEYGIPEDLHPELPGPEDTIVDFPEGKVGVYTRFFEFANFRIPISQFLFDILGYYQIHLSQLSVIGAAKVSHFEISCRVLNIIPTLPLFRVFYVPSYNSGWMSFSKRPGKNTPQCYTKPLDSLKNWNNRFFWVDERVFPTVVDWRTSAPKDGMPTANSYSAADVTVLDTRRTPIQKQPEALLCLVGLSRRYFLGDDVYPTFLYDDDRDMDLFNLISAPNPAKVKTGSRPRAAHEVPLLTVTANRVIDMEDPTVASGSSGTPSTVERSPLDFDNENPAPTVTEGTGAEDQAQDVLAPGAPPKEAAATTEVIQEAVREEEVVAMEPPVNKRRKQMRCKRVNEEVKVNALPKDDSTTAKSVSNPDPLSYSKPQPFPEQDIAQSSKGTATEIPIEGVTTTKVNVQFSMGSPKSIDLCPIRRGVAKWILLGASPLAQCSIPGPVQHDLARQVAMGSQLRLRFKQDARLLKKARAKIARRDQRIQVREEEMKKLDQEIQSLRVVESEVHGLRNRTQNLETLLEAGEDIKKAAKAKNAELTKELEILRVQFSDLQVNNDQLSQQVSHLQAQVTGEERIKVAFEEFKKYEDNKVEQRCAEMDARQDKLSVDIDEDLYPHMLTAIAGMSEGLKYGIEHEKAGRDLADVDAYDPEANNKLVKAHQDLKDLKYLMVRAPEDPWDVKEEVPLEDAIATNISRAEKKKKCRVVCRTYGIGSAHHARCDGIPVSVPTVVPQGLAILLTDAGTQTLRFEDEASPRLFRSKSLPPMYNLDWP
ncbi:hypothetical protein Tco_0657056 [Tanacetum coccineum]|uniref:Transposase (putative) gypsy type domain-containing protein n=1 Tax=Tanacetum coccineum TaxID=301880 RepID=A0ABQ4XB56_9ASTR